MKTLAKQARVVARAPGIRCVSRAAGVSATTVSRVLNNHPVPTAETRRRVLAAVKQLGYRPDPLYSSAVRRQRSGQRGQPITTRTIAYLASAMVKTGADAQDGYYSEVMGAVHAAAQRRRYYLMVSVLTDLSLEIPDVVADQRVDGLLVEMELALPVREMLAARLPIAFVDRLYPELPADYVNMDDAAATREMLDYLWTLGHRRIALFLDSTDRVQNRAKLSAFPEYFARAGVPLPNPRLSTPRTITRATHRATLEAYVSDVLAARPRPTAIVASGNTYALDILDILRLRGVAVPTQMSVCSLNDLNSGLRANPPLTSVRAPMGEMGAAATELLIQRIAEPSCAFKQILIQGKLIERASCAPVPGER